MTAGGNDGGMTAGLARRKPIQNSKFKILHPCGTCPAQANSKFKIQNSKFKIQNSKFFSQALVATKSLLTKKKRGRVCLPLFSY
jgi:hypothetical protein